MSAKLFFSFLALLIFITLTLISPVEKTAAQVRSEPRTLFGRVLEATPPLCLSARFQLVDCNNTMIASLQPTDNAADLSIYLGQTVVINGFENGGDCPLLTVDGIRSVPDTCGNRPRVGENISFEGLLAITEVSICQQGRFELRDCQGNVLVRLTESENGPDLDSLVGRYIRINGNDVGIECVVVAVNSITELTNVCSSPQPQTGGGPREGILQRNANGGFELRDCQNRVKAVLHAVVNSPDMTGLLGQYVKIKGKMVIGRINIITVRGITVKANRCGQ